MAGQIYFRTFLIGLPLSLVAPADATTPSVYEQYTEASEYYSRSNSRSAAVLLMKACYAYGLPHHAGPGRWTIQGATADIAAHSEGWFHSESCAILGTLYWLGDGVAPDKTLAIEHYDLACHLETARRAQTGANSKAVAAYCAIDAAGTWYRPPKFPMTPEHRLRLAKKHYQSARYLRDADPMLDASRSDRPAVQPETTTSKSEHLPHTLSWKAPPNVGKAALLSLAAELLEDGCSDESMESCAALAAVYRQGLGVPADLTRAAALSQQACEGGYTTACGATSTPEPEPAP